MWESTYSKVYENIDKKIIWNLWTDINTWPKWNPGVEYCKLHGPFSKGQFFTLKPKLGPATKIQILDIYTEKKFVDCTKFFGAKMYGIHEMQEENGGIRLTTTMKITGPFSFFWKKIVAEKIVQKTPKQTENLVELARQLKK